MQAVLFFDDRCGLCQGTVGWLRRHDRRRRLRFEPLAGPAARAACARHGYVPPRDGEVLLLREAGGPGEGLLGGSAAVAAALRLLPWPWSWLGLALGFAPARLRDALYRVVARHRRRLGGSGG